MARSRREVNPPVREESSEEESDEIWDENLEETHAPPVPQDQAETIAQLL